LPATRIDLLRQALRDYGPTVEQAVTQLESLVNVDAAAQRKRIEALLPLAAKGDVRRGHAVFYSSKASCSSCHRLENAGGTTGPELSHVGETRTTRDILEAILFPSLSFVRGYEPVSIITQDGKTLNGIIKDETAKDYLVATGPDQIIHVLKADVEEIQPSKVSIMPAGLDKQLSDQDIADLVTFLKDSSNRH
jgi:putative heme-binding domain-containing protein